MKKKLLILASLLFAFFVLGFSMMRFARESISSSSHGVESISSDSAHLKQYYLPYPGMLPDHPLYAFKMVRDRGSLWMERDGVKKAKLSIYLADKRIGAAEVLLKGNQVDLAEMTAKKAEQYLANAFDQIRSIEESGENVDYLWSQFYRSSTAHKKKINEMMEMVEGDARVSLERVLESCEVYRDEVMSRLGLEDVEVVGEDVEEEFDPNRGYL